MISSQWGGGPEPTRSIRTKCADVQVSVVLRVWRPPDAKWLACVDMSVNGNMVWQGQAAEDSEPEAKVKAEAMASDVLLLLIGVCRDIYDWIDYEEASEADRRRKARMNALFGGHKP